MIRIVILSLAALIAAMALARPGVESSAQALMAQRPGPSASARRGLDFATVHCAGCHAVTAGRGSPNPESPTFEAVANQPGLTDATLRQFLRDSHNYPAAMQFEINQAMIDDLANYIVTLKSDAYRPAI